MKHFKHFFKTVGHGSGKNDGRIPTAGALKRAAAGVNRSRIGSTGRKAHCQLIRMEHQSGVGKACVFFAVHAVAQNRTAQIFHVHADLMRAPRFNAYAHKGIRAVYTDATVASVGEFSRFVIGRHGKAFTVRRRAAQMIFDFALKRRRMSAYDRDIFFFYPAVFKFALQKHFGIPVFRRNQNARRIFIEAVNDSRPQRSAAHTTAPPMIQKRIDQRVPAVSRPRMRYHARSLVDDRYLFVFK